MAAPVTGEANSPLQSSDHHLNPDQQTTPNSPELNLTVSQLVTSQTPNVTPNNNSGRSTSSMGKRKIKKPLRYSDSATGRGNTQSPNAKGNSATKSPGGRSPAMIEAEKIQSSLGTKNPSCIKQLVRAHVDPGYWMGFPQWYGKCFLPKQDCEMEFEDENEEIHLIKYIADKSGFSAGWKKFVTGHSLVEGDVLVFHLVEPSKFKVYTARANDLNSVDGALSVMNLEPQETDAPAEIQQITQQADAAPPEIQEIEERQLSPQPLIEQSGQNSEDVGSEILESCRAFSKPELSIEELKTFQDFHIMVKGLCIDSELPEDVRMNYYKLCMDRKEFLHDSLRDNLYYKLVAGMIGETVRIAIDIKNCTFTTTKEEFEAWDNSLNSFGILGMKVGFLRDRIHKLSSIMFEAGGRAAMDNYIETENKRKRIEDEIVSEGEKLAELKESSERLQEVVDEYLRKTVWKYEIKLQQELDAGW